MTNIIIQEMSSDRCDTEDVVQSSQEKELLEYIIKTNPNNYRCVIRDQYPELFFNICSKYSQLTGFKFKTKLYWYIHELIDFPTYVCPVCNSTQYLNRDVFNVNIGYDKWMNRSGCCLRCTQLNPVISQRKKDTNIKRCGKEFYSMTNECKEKMKSTMIERYGVEHYSQSDEYNEKVRRTSIERYGVEIYSKTEERRKRIQLAWQLHSESQNDEIQNKRKQTCIAKYGVEYPSQLDDVKQKIRQTSFDKYGVYNYNQTEQAKQVYIQTCLSRYGVEYASQSKSFRDKVRNTCLERYGVQNYAQTEEYHKNKRHKYHSEKYPGITFDSNWEVLVYEFCRDNNIDVEYSPEISFKYEYDGRTWTYHPDFLINGKVYEVKGDNFFRINESTGDEEMFCPYRYDDWSEEHYSWMCGKYEAKHQCMIANNVIIIRGQNLNNLKDVFNL